MNKYQLLYIIDNGLAEESKNEIVDKFSALIESLGGTVEAIDKWGTKKFAYEIAGKTEGYYVLVKFSADAGVPAEQILLLYFPLTEICDYRTMQPIESEK